MAASNGIETDAVPYLEDSPNELYLCSFEKHKYLMGSELRKDNFEILIISHEDDDKQVRKFQQSLMENVKYSKYNVLVKPKVELHRDLIYEDDSPTPELDFSLRKATVVFLYATHSFSMCQWTVFEGRVSLGNVVKMGSHSLFVVHTKPKDKRDYSLPSTLTGPRDLCFSEDDKNEQFYKNVANILNKSNCVQYKKDVELYNKRLGFFQTKYPHILKHYKLNNDPRILGQTDLVANPQTPNDPKQCADSNQTRCAKTVAITEESSAIEANRIDNYTKLGQISLAKPSGSSSGTETGPDVEVDNALQTPEMPKSLSPSNPVKEDKTLVGTGPGESQDRASGHAVDDEETSCMTSDLTELKLIDDFPVPVPKKDHSTTFTSDEHTQPKEICENLSSVADNDSVVADCGIKATNVEFGVKDQETEHAKASTISNSCIRSTNTGIMTDSSSSDSGCCESDFKSIISQN